MFTVDTTFLVRGDKCELYIANLPVEVNEDELDSLFSKVYF